jgi:hypothetical protein
MFSVIADDAPNNNRFINITSIPTTDAAILALIGYTRAKISSLRIKNREI